MTNHDIKEISHIMTKIAEQLPLKFVGNNWVYDNEALINNMLALRLLGYVLRDKMSKTLYIQ